MGFVVLADLNDLVVDGRGSRTLCQQMLAADPFDGLAHHGSCAQIDQQIAQFADCRVAGNAGSGVRTAALDAQHQLGDVAQLFRLHGGFRCHLAGGANRFLNGLEGTALFLNAKGNDRLAGHGLDLFTQLCVGNGLTAQTDDNDAVNVRVAGKARQDFLRHRGVGSNIGAAGVEHDVDRTAHLTCHDPAALTAAGAGGKDQDMVADTCTAFFAFITPELHLRFLLIPVPFRCHSHAVR